MIPKLKRFPVLFPTQQLRPGWFAADDPLSVHFRDSWGDARSGGRWHNGTDIAAKTGALIVAAFGGTCSWTGWDDNGGWGAIITSHSKTTGTLVQTYYGHSAVPAFVHQGERVEAGQPIGVVGRSGGGKKGSHIKSAAHLHIRITVAGEAINPYPLLIALLPEGARGERLVLDDSATRMVATQVALAELDTPSSAPSRAVGMAKKQPPARAITAAAAPSRDAPVRETAVRFGAASAEAFAKGRPINPMVLLNMVKITKRFY